MKCCALSNQHDNNQLKQSSMPQNVEMQRLQTPTPLQAVCELSCRGLTALPLTSDIPDQARSAMADGTESSAIRGASSIGNGRAVAKGQKATLGADIMSGLA